jgi:lipid-A-disaccharide synthase
MRAAGVELLADSSDWGAIGVLEAASKIPRVWMTLRRTRAHLAEAPPSALVLIDCGAFNMPLARAARRMGLPTLYYLPPGSWSRRARNSELRDLVDVVATPFLWSRELLAGGRAEVEWVGHPVVEAARPKLTPEEARGRYGLDRSRPVVALAPGSREQEMHYLLPVLAGAAKRLLEDRNGAQFVVPVAATVDGNRVRDALNEVGAEPKLLDGMEYDALQLAGAAAVCSGTATLELACLGVPMVVVYRASRATTLQYRLFRGMIGRQQWAAMPNIIAGREVVRELLGSAATAEAVAVEVGGLLGDRERRRRMREGLAEVVSSLGLPGASARTATLVLEMIGLQEGAGVQS